MNQFSFDFNAPQEPVSEPSAPKEATPATQGTARVEQNVAPCAPVPEEGGFEALAKQLEKHPDFRVLRRLVPITDFGPRPDAADASDAPRHFYRVLVLDTETTGLSHQVDKIIELALLMVSVDSATGLPFGPVDLYEGFEDPGMPIPAVAKEVTGITDEMVRGMRLDDEAVAQMLAKADLIVAHNAGFDRPFVEARFPAFADKAWGCSFKDIDWNSAGASSLKLGALAADQGWFFEAHRAQVDCHALLQVLACPVGASGVTGLGHLMAAASQPSFKLSANGAPFECKDALKGRGYRWDAEAKVWGSALASEQALEEELDWLSKHVYVGRSVSLEVELLDSRVRYSSRRGPVSKRRL